MSVPPRAVQLNEANAFLKDHPEVLYVDPVSYTHLTLPTRSSV